MEFRDTIYNIFICNLDLSESLHEIIIHFIANGSLNNKNIDSVLFKLCKFYKLYNNNYRPIYHLESFLYYLCKVVNEL